MAFDSKEFLARRMVPREDVVKVPDLAEFFGEDEDPVWKVRGLSGQELGKAQVASEKSREIRAILEGLSSKNSKRMANSIKNLVDPDVPVDVAKRISMFAMGSVEPAGSEELALKLCREFPVDFYAITNKIVELTGMGHHSGEPKPSGTIEKSEPV